jgi:hypothetical protein
MSEQDFEDILASSGNDKPKKETMTNTRESLGSLFIGLGETIKVKVLLFIFVMYILLNSDYFVHNILSKMSPDAVDGQIINGTGVIIQALLYVALCGVFIALDEKGLV